MNYYAWTSDERKVGVVDASSAEEAAHKFALRVEAPYNVALRIVPVEAVYSYGFRLAQAIVE